MMKKTVGKSYNGGGELYSSMRSNSSTVAARASKR
jgi:hypothetical protein